MGASDLFNVGITGLTAARRGLEIAGHNIANANTPGFSRQRVELAARPPANAGFGFIGSGVEAASVRRIVDQFLVDQVRSASAELGQAERFHAYAQQVDNLLADPSTGVSPALTELFSALNDLADDPSSMSSRQVVLSRAESLVERFHTIERSLDSIAGSIRTELQQLTREVNTLAAGIGELNLRISVAEASVNGQPANDLRDERDEKLRELARRVGISTIEGEAGALSVTLGSGQALVTGTTVARLDVVADSFDASRSAISYTAGGTSLDVTSVLTGGELSGVLDFSNRVLDDTRNGLGRVALGFAHQVNTRHRLGIDRNGDAGQSFFNGLGAVSPRVLAHSANTGVPPASLSVTVQDPAGLSTSDYLLERSGATYSLTKRSDGTTQILSGFPTAPQQVDGMVIDLTAGTIASGDRLLIQPTRLASRELSLELSDPGAIAAAAPVLFESSL